MPANDETTTRFKADISELKAAMQEASRQVRLANSEFQAATSGMDNWSSSADGLSAKIHQLNSVLDAEKSKLSNLNKQYELTVQQYGENSRAAEDLRIRINNQQAVIGRTERELRNYQAALDEVSDESENTEKASKKAAKGMKNVSDKAEDAADSADSLSSKLGDIAKKGFAAIGAAATSAATAFFASAEATREYREDMGKLQTAFATAGHSADTATETYKSFFSVLGEEDRSVEAVSHLAKLTSSQEELSQWTDICAGVWGTFGDSLPIEGLTEAANETAKVGQVTGPLADALNWAGISEDKFNEALASCNSEQERATLITETLNALYSDAAETYKEVNGGVMEAQRAQSELTDAMAQVGAVAEPVMTSLKMLGAEMLNSLLPSIELLGGGFSDMLNGIEGGGEIVGEGISNIITTALGKITELLPSILEMGLSLVTNLIEGILAALPQLVTVAIEIINSLILGLTTAIPEIATAVIEIVPQIIDALMQGLPAFIQAAIDFLMGIVQAIPTVIDAILVALPQIVTSIIDGLLAAFPQLLEGALTLLMAIIDAIPVIAERLIVALPTIITSIITALMNAIPQLLQAAITFLMAIVQAIPQLIITLSEQIPNIVIAITTALVENIPLLLETAVTLFMTIVQAIPTIIAELAKAVPQIITAIIGGLSTLSDELGNLLGEAFDKFVEWGKDVIDNGKESATEFVENVGEFMKDLPYNIGKLLGNVIAKVVDWGVNFYNEAKKAGENFLNGVIDFVKNIPSNVYKFLTETLPNVVKWGKDLAKKGKEAAEDLFDSIVDKIKGLPDEMLDVGSNLVEGLWNGINNMSSWVSKKIEGFSDGVLDGIKDFFGIHSPSRVMKKEIGENLAEGVAIGYGEGMENATTEANKVNYEFLQSLKHDMKSGQKELDEAGQKQAEATQKKLAEAAKEHLTSLKDSLTNITKEYQSELSSIEKTINSFKSSLTKSFTDVLTFDKNENDEIIGAHATNEIKKNTKELEEYLALIEKLRKRGLSDTLLNQLSSMSIEEGKAVAQYYASRTDEQLKALEHNWNKYNETAEKLAKELYSDEIKTATGHYMTEITAQLEDQSGEMQKIGLEYVKNLLCAFDITNPIAYEQSGLLIENINNMINSLNNADTQRASENVGENLMLGIANGVINASDVAANAIRTQCSNLLDIAREVFDIHSPSRVMEKLIGNNLVLGLAKGIESKAKTAVNAMRGLSEDVLAPAQKALSGFNSGMSSAPGAGNAHNVGGATYNFYQTNNSPKALSRLDIYRQTKNQIAMLKGV